MGDRGSWGAVERGRCRPGGRRPARRRQRLCRHGSRHPDQQRSVHEHVEPARDPGRARLVRLREHDRRDLPDRPLLQRRREQPRLVDLDERRPDVDDRRASGHDYLRRRAVGADQRPGRRLRPRARRLDDLGARHRRVGQRCGHPDAAARPTAASLGRTRSRSPLRRATFFDKNWIACDTWASSPHLRQLLHAMGRQPAGHPDDDEHIHRRRPHLGPDSACRPGIPPASAASRSSSRTGPSIVPYSETAPDRARSARPTAAPRGRPRPRRATSTSTASPATCARSRCPRPRSTATARSTSLGRTAASGRAAPRTTSS